MLSLYDKVRILVGLLLKLSALPALFLRCCPPFLADRSKYGRAYATVLRLSSSSYCTECIVAKRCVLAQKLLLAGSL